MSDAVLMEKSGGVAWITLNRPDAMNSINIDIREGLPRRLREADADPEVHVIVVRGAGPRAFCAGADIREFSAVDSPPAYRQSRIDNWPRVFDEIRKPAIASIHGFCLGGGFELALACDIRIASTDARFAFPETGLGIIPGASGTQRASRIAGLGIALDLVLTGERIDAERARAFGLVTRTCDPAALAEETRKLAEAVASKAPLASIYAKEAVRRGYEMELSAALRLEVDLNTHLLNTEDRLEAARAFKEKRPPRFSGK